MGVREVVKGDFNRGQVKRQMAVVARAEGHLNAEEGQVKSLTNQTEEAGRERSQKQGKHQVEVVEAERRYSAKATCGGKHRRKNGN